MRQLLVVADDFGIGLATSRGILELAQEGLISATLLLTNTPQAAASVALWQQQGQPVELGWHPCLTLDRPVLSPRAVPTLVRPDGRFLSLAAFLKRWLFRRVSWAEVRAEWAAQLARFQTLVGHPPRIVAAHHHLHIFPPLGSILLDILEKFRPRPYVRRVVEPRAQLTGLPGARIKRSLLALLGRGQASVQRRRGFPGNDSLIGITDASSFDDSSFFVRCLRQARGEQVELVCHPGREDATLIGREDTPSLPRARRLWEWQQLRHARFRAGVHQNGFTIVPPTAWCETLKNHNQQAA